MNTHIDGDIIAYRASAATQGKIYSYLGEDYEAMKEMELIYGSSFRRDAVETRYEPEPVGHAYKILNNLMEDYSFSSVYVGGKANFRYKVGTIKDYKGQRSSTKRPPHLDACKQYLCDNYDAVRPSGPWETDDEISLSIEPGDTLVSIDKDFLQIHDITLEDTLTGKGIETTTQSGMASLYCQCMLGDSADNIPGCYGIGKKSALLAKVKKCETEEEMFEVVLEQYKRRYHNYAERFMCENLKLLYLLRAEELQWVDWLGAVDFYKELKGVV